MNARQNKTDQQSDSRGEEAGPLHMPGVRSRISDCGRGGPLAPEKQPATVIRSRKSRAHHNAVPEVSSGIRSEQDEERAPSVAFPVWTRSPGFRFAGTVRGEWLPVIRTDASGDAREVCMSGGPKIEVGIFRRVA